MKLQLPADPAEKKKILILIGIFAAGILYGLFQFVLSPYFSQIRTNTARIEELEDLLWKADREIKQTPKNLAKNAETISHILEVSETQRHVLAPSLGNYLLVAEAIIMQTASDAGVNAFDIREITPPLRDPTKAKSSFWPYALAVGVEAGLHDLTKFIHLMQKNNPYLAITSMIITAGTPDSPAKHRISLTVQWPTWSDPESPNRLAAERLADGEQR